MLFFYILFIFYAVLVAQITLELINYEFNFFFEDLGELRFQQIYIILDCFQVVVEIAAFCDDVV